MKGRVPFFSSLLKNRTRRVGFLVFLLLSSALMVVLFHLDRFESGEMEENEGEGIPSILKQMDLWSEMRTYPFKSMDATAFLSSYKQARAMRIEPGFGRRGVQSITSNPWTCLGPMNFSGRILCVGFHPTIPNTMWVGSASGGLWKTTTGGTGGPGGISWQYVPTGAFPVLGVSSIAINPASPSEMYIGTGEVYNPAAAATGSTGAGHTRTFRGSYGIGILKTIDGGTNWTKSLDFADSTLKGVMDLAINPTTPSTVFAATTDGLYRTTNSGATWTLIHSVVLPMDLCFKPGDPNVLYVGCGNFASTGTGIYKTTNANAPSPTFTKLTSPNLPNPISGKIQIAISANNPSKVYASIGRDPNTTDVQGLYVSTNEGSTWAACAAAGATTILGNQGWYAHEVAVSSADANRVYWGELDSYRSTDGGANFTQVGIWSNWDVNNTTVGTLQEGINQDYVHADVHRMYVSPHDATGNTLFFCTDGGLFRTTDGGNNFQTLNGGLNTSQIYANMTVHPTNANYMLAGLQDNEAMVYEGNPGCRRIGSLGDGFHTAMNFNGTIQLVESYYFNRRRSTNSGTSFAAGSGAVAELACFNTPMVFSKAASSAYMFAGTIYFKRSTNSGSTWTNLNGGAAIAGANNPCIAMAAPTNDIVYFSTAPGGGVRSKLWKTTNGTAASPTFTEITGTLPDRYYSYIAVDPVDPNRVLVALSGFGTSHLYLTVDGGSSWSNLGALLPNVPHTCIFINPADRSQVYVGNDLGVFVTNNVPLSGPLGATTSAAWVSYSEGLGDAIMANDIILTNTNKLRLATYGRGIWERDVAPNTLPITLKEFNALPVAAGNQLNWKVAAQSGTDRYEVQYSSDGINFSKIASVPAKTGSGDIDYAYLHKAYNETDVFYRLKTIDADGSFQYSYVAVVKARQPIVKLSVFPNPTPGAFKVRVPLDNAGIVRIRLYDNAGKLVLVKTEAGHQGMNEIPVDIGTAASGVYRLVCESNSSTWKTTIIKK